MGLKDSKPGPEGKRDEVEEIEGVENIAGEAKGNRNEPGDNSGEPKGSHEAVRSFGGLEIVRCESETRGNVGVEGVEGMIVCATGKTHSGVEGNEDETDGAPGGPDEGSNEGCGPDDDDEPDTFKRLEVSDERWWESGDNSTGLSGVSRIVE